MPQHHKQPRGQAAGGPGDQSAKTNGEPALEKVPRKNQRRRALALEEQVWTRTWRRAKPGEKLRLKYKEFL